MVNNALVLWNYHTVRPFTIELSNVESNECIVALDASFKFSTLTTVNVAVSVTDSSVVQQRSGQSAVAEVVSNRAVMQDEKCRTSMSHLRLYEMVSNTSSVSSLHAHALPFMLPWQFSCKLLTFPLLLVQQDSKSKTLQVLTVLGFRRNWAKFFSQGYEQHCSITHTCHVDVPPLITPWFNLKSPAGANCNDNHMALIIKVLKKKLCLKDPVKSKKNNKKGGKPARCGGGAPKDSRVDKTKTADAKTKCRGGVTSDESEADKYSYPSACDDNIEEDGGECIELMEEVIGDDDDEEKLGCYDLSGTEQDQEQDEDEEDVGELADAGEDKECLADDNEFPGEFEDGELEDDDIELEDDDELDQEDEDEEEGDEIDLEDEDDLELEDETKANHQSDVGRLTSTVGNIKSTLSIVEIPSAAVVHVSTKSRTTRKKQKL